MGGDRARLAEAALGLIPGVKRRLQASLPEEMRSELSRVTWHQVEALKQLSVSQGSAGATMTELARLQSCALSSATALVDRLIAQGLAQRRPDPLDRRVIRIAPTAGGEQLLKRFEIERRRIALEALAPLSDDEVATLLQLMRKLAGEGEAVGEATADLEVAHG
jgi:DNA-binding MarR family transcriptional regulator